MNEPLEPFLRDLVALLLEMRQARAQADDATEDGAEYRSGLAFGLFETIALVHSQLLAFGYAPERFGFQRDFNPERDLL